MHSMVRLRRLTVAGGHLVSAGVLVRQDADVGVSEIWDKCFQKDGGGTAMHGGGRPWFDSSLQATLPAANAMAVVLQF